MKNDQSSETEAGVTSKEPFESSSNSWGVSKASNQYNNVSYPVCDEIGEVDLQNGIKSLLNINIVALITGSIVGERTDVISLCNGVILVACKAGSSNIELIVP